MIVLAVMTAVMVGIVRGPERAALHAGHRVHVARAFQARDEVGDPERVAPQAAEQPWSLASSAEKLA